MSSSGLVLLAALGGLLWFWQNSLRARELALRAARAMCRAQQLQLLDATVSAHRLQLQRGEEGRLQLRRTFQFSYSEDGDSRHTGFVIVAGNRIEQMGL
jgi:hypothetical protein